MFSGGAAALVLAALVASLSILAHPAGNASATSLAAPMVRVTHGCDVGDGTGDWVEAVITPGAQVVDPDNPVTVQVGLAVTPDNSDLYPETAGPVLLSLTGAPQTVRLSGPIKGAHVFVRKYLGSAVLATVPVPVSCKHVPKTNLGESDPEVTGISGTANCEGSAAEVTVKIHNGASADADYTVLLVGPDGSFLDPNPQGVPVHVPANSWRPVQLQQDFQTTNTQYRYQVRVLALDGGGSDAATRHIVCDAQGHHGGGPTVTPIRPTVSPTATPPVSGKPTSSAPTSRPVSSSSPVRSTPRSSTSAPVSGSAIARRGASGARPSSTPTAGGQGSPGGTADVTGPGSVDDGGAVLGDADSTSQPSRPAPSSAPTHAKQVLVEPASLSRAATSSFAVGVALILLAFAAAIAGMVAANRASARRR